MGHCVLNDTAFYSFLVKAFQFGRDCLLAPRSHHLNLFIAVLKQLAAAIRYMLIIFLFHCETRFALVDFVLANNMFNFHT